MDSAPTDWLSALSAARAAGRDSVLVTVVEQGSTPREAGAKMLVTANSAFDTIGGGNVDIRR